jgi:hypothetical protein
MKHSKKKHHMEYTQPPRNRRRLRVLVDTAVATDVVVAQRLGIGIQVAGIAIILFSLASAIGLSYNIVTVPGSNVLALSAGTCIDGTAELQCVVDRTGNENQRPWRCVNGILVEDSGTCGCPTGRYPWGDGSCTTYPNIKTHNQFIPYCSWSNSLSENYTATCAAELSFNATHFDNTSTFTHQKQYMRNINPNLKLQTYRNFSALTATEVSTAYPAYCLTHGCTTENAFIHFTEDSRRNGRGYSICVPGYNPANPPPPGDVNSCVLDSADHYARAVSLPQSRIPDFWLTSWMMVNYRDPGIAAYNQQAVEQTFRDGNIISDSFFTDIGDYIAQNGPDLTVSDVYPGIALNQSHPRVQETWDTQKALATYLTNTFGQKKDHVSNARDTATFFYYPGVADGYRNMEGKTYFEVWEAFDFESDTLPSGGGGRAHYYSLDYINSKNVLARSLQGQKFILQGANQSTNPDKSRAKTYLLSYYYLLNNSNLTFAYHDYASRDPATQVSTLTVPEYSWVAAAEYNVGQPTTNSLGLADVFGNMNTTEHFVFAQGNDPSTPSNINASCTGVKLYRVMGRQYTNALVLTKIREYCGRLGTSSNTTHALPQHSGGNNLYRPLRADGTLGDPISQITLRNSEGAILIPDRPAGSCSEIWTCTAWTSCSNGQQTRRCSDLATCGTTQTKPAESQACSASTGDETPPGGGGEPPPVTQVVPPGGSCTPDWNCSNWSTCSATSRLQSRTCTDQRQCVDEIGKYTEERLCAAGGTGDTRPPETTIGSIPSVVNSGVVKVTLGGSDNVTKKENLRYYYRLDDQAQRVAPKASTLTIRNLTNGPHKLVISAVDENSNQDPTPVTRSFTVRNVLSIVTAPKEKADTIVRTYDYLGKLRSQFRPFPATTRWGASVDVMDVEGDGKGEIVLAPGPGGPPEVRIVTPKGIVISKFFAFPRNYLGGVNVAAADLNGDGRDEVIAVAGSGTGPLIRVFTWNGKLIAQQHALDKSFRGGVSVAAGFLNRLDRASFITAPASNGKPEISVWELSNGRLVRTKRFVTDSPSRRVGLSLAIANVDGAGLSEIIVTTSAGKRPPSVQTFSASGTPQVNFLAGQVKFLGGTVVAAGDLQTFDNRAEIVTAPVKNATAATTIYALNGASSTRLRAFLPFGARRLPLNIAIGHL